jgi:hypothetical protein
MSPSILTIITLIATTWWQTLPTTIATNHEIDNVEGIYGVEGVKEKVMERELVVKSEKQN